MTHPVTLQHTSAGLKVVINSLDDATVEALERAAMMQRVNLFERQLKGAAVEMLARNEAVTAATRTMADLSEWLDFYAAAGEDVGIPVGRTAGDGMNLRDVLLPVQGIAAPLMTLVADRTDPDGSSNDVVEASGFEAKKSEVRNWVSQIQANIQNLLSFQPAESLRIRSLKDRLNETRAWMHSTARSLHESRANIER